jgi:thiol-disulfide isomerase/thioredoxin
MKPILAAVSVAVCLLAAAPADAASAPSLPSANVAWLPAAADADIGRAFARAKSEKKPLLLYWGASWCPPCNQLKVTLFNHQEFANLSRSFVAVHVDGDRPGAQKLGQRFNVSGYPTVVLMTADGQEITRLPGEVDAPQMLAVLQQAIAGGRPVRVVLADALAGKTQDAADWRQLAFYSWETDEQQLIPKAEVPGTLVKLAAASPAVDADTTTRLWLMALAASDEGKGVKPDAALRERVLRVLTDPAQSRLHMDLVTGGAREITRALDGDEIPAAGAAPTPLMVAYETALKRLEADPTLSRGDRLGALYARVGLARQGYPKDVVQIKLPEPLLQDVREHVARDDREITNGYERQAVITEAASLLGRAGLWAESDALLKANLAKSPSPYYLMSQLGSNARKLGRTDEALRWYEQAYIKSEGPATRLQWGAGYLSARVELAPQDAVRIEKLASQIFAEAAKDKGAFEGRSVHSLQRASTRLMSWNADGKQAATIKRLRTQLDGTCPKVDAGEARSACDALLKPAAKKAA